MAALPLNRNLSCSDKVLLTGSSGFSSSLAVPGLPWGISSMPPTETPSATQPIPYSNDATHCCLIGRKVTEVSSPRSSVGAVQGLEEEGLMLGSGHNETVGSHGDNGGAQSEGAQGKHFNWDIKDLVPRALRRKRVARYKVLLGAVFRTAYVMPSDS